MGRRTKDLTGQQFGKLTVIERVENAINGEAQWCCLCDCGNTTIVTTHNLTTQHTQSCGCLKHMGNPTPNYKNKYIICEQFATCVVNDVQEFKFDIDDLPLVKKYHWHINTRGYVISNTLEYLHRIVMKPPLNKVVDHINGDTLDNRKCNLRICTPSNNSMNRMKQTNNTSGVIGVNFFKLITNGEFTLRSIIKLYI